MKVLVFDLRAPLAHFRRPDTMGTHATYPFIPRTALRGLAASILGRSSVPSEVRCGLRLLCPVRTVSHELSLHGKAWVGITSKEDEFSRPTAVELIVEPRYRVYYTGPFIDELGERIRAGRSQYHTYLGSAFCLTFPEWVREEDVEPITLDPGRPVTCDSVVPVPAVSKLLPEEGREYARVGGLLWEHIGGRRFRGSVSVFYEAGGGPLTFLPRNGPDTYSEFCEIPGEGVVCLW